MFYNTEKGVDAPPRLANRVFSPTLPLLWHCKLQCKGQTTWC